MSDRAARLIEAAKLLTPEERERVALVLLDEPVEPLSPEWVEVISRRAQEVLRGEVSGRAAEDVFQDARGRLRSIR